MFVKLKEHLPIDKDYVKSQWDEIINIPNDQWEILGIDSDLNLINSEDYPYTSRELRFNLLPHLVIQIIINIKK